MNSQEYEKELNNLLKILSIHHQPTLGCRRPIPGIDHYTQLLPLKNDLGGGDYIRVIDFENDYDLDERIRVSSKKDVAFQLEKNKSRVGILVVDVAGHQISDAALAAIVGHKFEMAAQYELSAHGQITPGLFEKLNHNLYRTTDIQGRQVEPKLITVLYGEISSEGVFRFISAGHPYPTIYRAGLGGFDESIKEGFSSGGALGMMPSTNHIDKRRRKRKNEIGDDGYQVNQVQLESGDVLLIPSDGLYEHGMANGCEPFFPRNLESIVKDNQSKNAQDIAQAIIEGALTYNHRSDDISVCVVKRTT